MQGPVNESEIILGETPAAPVSYNGSSVFVMLRMILVLALAALAIYGVVFFIKRLARPQESRDPHLKILARVPFGSDCFAAVVSLGPKAWLVGGGSGGLNLISEVEDTETLETLLLEDARKSAESGAKAIDFRSLLGRFGKNQGVKGLSSHADDLRKQRERLKGL
jgi:flagellar protein FliO/FliZ